MADSPAVQDPIETLTRIVERNQVWPRMAARYGVDNPVPPWKTSLDGMCDAMDRGGCRDTGAPTTTERRDEEDALTASVYAGMPYPESQLVSLAHTLLRRGLVDEAELAHRLDSVRARLES